MGTGNTRRGGSASGGKSTKTADEQRTTKHQGVGGRNLGDKSLRSGPTLWEWSDPRQEEIRTRRTESSQRGPKGYDGGMWNSHRNTQHPVRAIRGAVDGATRLTTGQHRDRGPAGDETHQRHSHLTELRLHGMGDGGRESTRRGNHHCLEERGGMGGLGSAEFWTKRGKFYNNVGEETLVRRRGLRAAQRPTYDQLYKETVRVQA